MIDRPLEREVLIVGAGIGGLVTAWRLREAGVRVLVLEVAAAAGGCMQSEARDGVLLEKGPFNVRVRDEAFHALLDRCAGETEPITAAPEARVRYVLRRGELHAVPDSAGGLVRCGLLSGRAKLRLVAGLILSRRAGEIDPSIDDAARRRFGAEVAETFVSAFAAGVFGGDSRALGLRACFPAVWRFDQVHRSPLLAAVAARRQARARRWKGLLSFRRGLRALPEWLAGRLGPDLRTGCPVEAIEPRAGGWEVTVGGEGRGERITGQRIVLATPAAAAAGLLRPLAPAASAALESIPCASLVVVNLVYPRAAVARPLRGFGFLVPAAETGAGAGGGGGLLGVLFAESAFPHHAGGGERILRVFMGGARDPEAVEKTEGELVETARRELGGRLGIRVRPRIAEVCRWPQAIPQYHRGHGEVMERLESALRQVPGIHLVGNYRGGVSINDRVREGTAAAEAIARALAG